jgi:Fibrinogen beta and gamma chains, C-terminal globular domain
LQLLRVLTTGLKLRSLLPLIVDNDCVLVDYVAQIEMTNVSVAYQPTTPTVNVFGWWMMMQRNGSSYNWALPWSSYRNGFGSTGNDFWLGLERIYQLTQRGKCRLRFELLISGSWVSAEYWSFTLGDEAGTQYRIDVDGLV